MAILEVGTEIDAPIAEVWADLALIDRHVEWMADAREITFVGDQTSGVGTRFDCLTVVGPFRLTDRMEVTEWVEERRMGVHHRGLVTGSGVFELTELPGNRTRFAWREELHAPWFLGGRIAARLALPLLRRIWNGSMTTLAARFVRP